jgi:hypothetical protein
MPRSTIVQRSFNDRSGEYLMRSADWEPPLGVWLDNNNKLKTLLSRIHGVQDKHGFSPGWFQSWAPVSVSLGSVSRGDFRGENSEAKISGAIAPYSPFLPDLISSSVCSFSMISLLIEPPFLICSFLGLLMISTDLSLLPLNLLPSIRPLSRTVPRSRSALFRSALPRDLLFAIGHLSICLLS